MRKIAVALCLMILSATGANAEDTARQVSVVGTAVTRVVPDVIAWRITIREFDRTPMRAVNRSNVKLEGVLGLAKQLGVPASDIQTSRLDIQREYNRDEKGRQTTFKHFAITRSVSLRQSDFSRFDEFVSKLLSEGELEVNYSLESTGFHEIRAETRLKAVRIAKEKAEGMCRELGARLGEVIRIDEYKQSDNRAMYGGYLSNAGGFSDYGRSGPQSPDAVEGTFAPGAIEIKVTVYVDFEIGGTLKTSREKPEQKNLARERETPSKTRRYNPKTRVSPF